MGKKRLRPWLEDHLNKNTFHGLKWVNKEKRVFSIPWKSKKNNNWSVTDAKIFKAWASKSGKLKEGDPEKPAAWKAQLRMAFHKLPDIKEVQELHDLNDRENPFKVYIFVDKGNKSFESKSDTAACSSSSQISPGLQMNFLEASGTEWSDARNSHQHGLHGMTFNPNIPTVVYNDGGSPHSLNDTAKEANVVLELSNTILPTTSCQQFQEPERNVSNMAASIQQTAMGNNESPQQIPDAFWYVENFDTNSYGPTPSNYQNQQSFENDSSSSASEPESILSFIKQPVFEIKVYMLEQCVMKELIDEKGVRLFYGDLSQHRNTEAHIEVQEIYGPMDIKQMSIRDIDEFGEALLINERQKKNIKDVLKNMERGLVLRVMDDGMSANICAQRLCRTRVFIRNQEGKNMQLDRKSNLPECIFDLDKFRHHLHAYVENNGPIPSPTIIITFGQECKADFVGKSRAHVYAKVTHLGAEELLREAISNKQGDSEVLISSISYEDVLADIFKQRLSL